MKSRSLHIKIIFSTIVWGLPIFSFGQNRGCEVYTTVFSGQEVIQARYLSKIVNNLIDPDSIIQFSPNGDTTNITYYLKNTHGKDSIDWFIDADTTTYTEYFYNEKGLLNLIVDHWETSDSTIHYYDQDDRLIKIIEIWNESEKSTVYTDSLVYKDSILCEEYEFDSDSLSFTIATYLYNEKGLLESITTLDKIGNTRRVHSYSYDTKNRLIHEEIKTLDRRTNSLTLYRDILYNEDGDVTRYEFVENWEWTVSEYEYTNHQLNSVSVYDKLKGTRSINQYKCE